MEVLQLVLVVQFSFQVVTQLPQMALVAYLILQLVLELVLALVAHLILLVVLVVLEQPVMEVLLV